MGAWGAGLYANDFALDLRSAISAVSRLPFDGRKVLEIVRQTEPAAADEPGNEDHCAFWLVLADQFQKRGIDCSEVATKALELIDSGADLATLETLGMPDAGLRKRRKMLAELRDRLRDGSRKPRRVTIKKPQALIMSVGDVFRYPTSRGKPINSYAPTKEYLGWVQDAWAAMLVVDCGRAFDYLAWYSIVAVQNELSTVPTVELLLDIPWVLGGAGTCSATHFRRLELEAIGTVAIDVDAIAKQLGNIAQGIRAAVSDISIVNVMRVASENPSQRHVQFNLRPAKSSTLRSLLRS